LGILKSEPGGPKIETSGRYLGVGLVPILPTKRWRLCQHHEGRVCDLENKLEVSDEWQSRELTFSS
jgi:hypothetical protein